MASTVKATEMVYRIELDTDACIGCVACTKCEQFEMRDDMKAHPTNILIDTLGCVQEVADECPVGAITILVNESAVTPQF